MKLIMTVLILVSSAQGSLAKVINWNSQRVSNTYKSTKKIQLHSEEKKINLPKGTEFELFEISNLNMIKVHLHKYKVTVCPTDMGEVDLETIEVNQGKNLKNSVAVSLTRDCNIEIFIDMKEYNTKSFLEKDIK